MEYADRGEQTLVESFCYERTIQRLYGHIWRGYKEPHFVRNERAELHDELDNPGPESVDYAA